MPKTNRRDDIPRWTPAGEYRHKAAVSTHSTAGVTYGARGQVVYASTTQFETRCKIETLSGNEGVLARSLYPTATHRLTCRYDSRINEEAKFVVGSRSFYPYSIDNLRQEGREIVMIVGEEK